MYFGLDIGSHKTVVFTSKGHTGEVVLDKLGNGEISTIIDISKEGRRFGKHVPADRGSDVIGRYRGFIKNIKDPKNQEHLVMFFGYLNSLISDDSASIALAIPDTFSEEERIILLQLIELSPLAIKVCFSQLTSAASYAAFYEASMPEKFVICDFGHHKTSIGAFHLKDNKLTAMRRMSIPRGASDFDEILYNELLARHSDVIVNDFMKEKLVRDIETIKKGLNELDRVKIRIKKEDEDESNKDDLRNFYDITCDQYRSLTSEVLADIGEFCHGAFNDPVIKDASGHVELIGKNSNSRFIAEIMAPYCPHKHLQCFFAIPKGACVAHVVNLKKGQHRVNEIAGREVSLAVDGKEPEVVIKHDSVVGTVSYNCYDKGSSFVLDVFDSGLKVGEISITYPEESKLENMKKQEADNDEEGKTGVEVGISIGKYCTIEVNSVTLYRKDLSKPVPLGYKYTTHGVGLSCERLEEIRKVENEYLAAEREEEERDIFRSECEQYFFSIEKNLNKCFPGFMKEEGRTLLNTLLDEYAATEYESLEIEKKKKENLIDSLSDLNERLKAIERKVRSEVEDLCARMRPHLVVTREMTMAQREYFNVYSALEHFGKSINIDLMNFTKYSSDRLETLKKDYERVELFRMMYEADEKRKEEEKRNKTEVPKEEGESKENTAQKGDSPSE